MTLGVSATHLGPREALPAAARRLVTLRPCRVAKRVMAAHGVGKTRSFARGKRCTWAAAGCSAAGAEQLPHRRCYPAQPSQAARPSSPHRALSPCTNVLVGYGAVEMGRVGWAPSIAPSIITLTQSEPGCRMWGVVRGGAGRVGVLGRAGSVPRRAALGHALAWARPTAVATTDSRRPAAAAGAVQLAQMRRHASSSGASFYDTTFQVRTVVVAH